MTSATPSRPSGGPKPVGDSNWQLIRCMGVVGLIAGCLIVTTYNLTLPTIKRKQQQALEAAIFEVIPGASSVVPYTLAQTDGQWRPQRLDPGVPGARFYAAYAADNTLSGIAIEAMGQGFQETIRVLYGYHLGEQRIIGLKVLESKETPGLGSKIETDPAFRANFVALEVTLDESGTQARHPLELVKPGKREQAWQIDGITGATISSRAITEILRASTGELLPLIQGQRHLFLPETAKSEGQNGTAP